MTGGKHYKGIVLLGLLLVCLPVVTWKFALAGTYSAMRETSRLNRALAGYGDFTPESISDSRDYTTDGDIITEGLILDMIAECIKTGEVKVTEYQPYTGENSGGMTVKTAEMTLTGGYIPIVRVLEELENNVQACRVKSVEFEKTRELRENRSVLKASIIVQQVIQDPT
ncbi:MAG: hypothetical protein LUF87_07915 [Alistipes sp.]|nr:hypothetical protein [Alistipes sp.]